MDAEEKDRLLITLFERLREVFEPKDGNELVLLENLTCFAVRIRRRPRSDEHYPRFRVVIWSGAAGLNVVYSQTGDSAGPPRRGLVRYDSPDIVDRVVRATKEYVTFERKRLIDYRAEGR